MRHLSPRAALLLFAAASAFAAPAHAAVIVSLPGGTPLTIPNSNVQNATGPISFGPGVTFTTSSPTALFGWTGVISQYQSFPWLGNPAIALNNVESTFTLTFDAPVKAFLGQITLGKAGYAGYSNRMSAYDAAGNQLDYIDFMANGQQQFAKGYYGFSYAGADLKRVTFTNDYIAVRNISVVPGAVPEPAIWATMIIGFGFIGGAMRRKRGAPMNA